MDWSTILWWAVPQALVSGVCFWIGWRRSRLWWLLRRYVPQSRWYLCSSALLGGGGLCHLASIAVVLWPDVMPLAGVAAWLTVGAAGLSVVASPRIDVWIIERVQGAEGIQRQAEAAVTVAEQRIQDLAYAQAVMLKDSSFTACPKGTTHAVG